MKRSISLVLAILMVASLMVFGSVTASAEKVTLIAKDSDGWKAQAVAGNEGETFDVLPEGWTIGEGIEAWDEYSTPMNLSTWDNIHDGARPAFGAVKEFEVTDPESIVELKMWIHCDEDPVVYLNGTQVHTATGWDPATVDLTDYIDLLKEGTNVIAVAVKQGFGGCSLNLSLEAVAGEIELVDANGYVNVKKADCTSYWQGLGDPNHMLNDNPGDCCGGGFNNQEWTLDFYGDVAVSEIFLQTKGKEENGYGEGNFADENYTGDPTIFGFYSVYVGETLVATKVPARSYADGGFTLKLSNAITASSVKVVCTEWLTEPHLWANLNSFKVKAAETTESAVQYFGTQGSNVENAVRFVATTTSLDYDAVGMLISTTDLDGAVKTWNVATNKVYAALNSNGEKVPAPEGTSLFGVELYGIPANNTFDFTVFPYAKTADTMVIGTPAEDIVASVTETGSTIGGEEEPAPEKTVYELEGGKYGSGMENWVNSDNNPAGMGKEPGVTEILYTIKPSDAVSADTLKAVYAAKADYTWTLTISTNADMSEAVTKVITPASHFTWNGETVRFEPCLVEGDNKFVPVKNTVYYINLVIEGADVVYKVTGDATGYSMSVDAVDPSVVPAGPTTFTLSPYGVGGLNGFENWAGNNGKQTQLLICTTTAVNMDYTWELTISDGENTKVINLKAATDYDTWLRRFEVCLGEGANQFIPVVGVEYTITAKVYNATGDLVMIGEPAADPFICGQDPIVP